MKRIPSLLKPAFIVILFLFISSVELDGQMPDWKYFRDREGNSYYYDRAFKIRITDTAGVDYIPVTSRGIDFYFHTGVELIKEGKYPEGLFYLKSIRALGDDNSRIRKVKIDAAKWMNYLEKKHGSRYESYDNESSVTITEKNNNYYLVNSKLFYRITIPDRPYLLKKEWKYYGKGYGLKFGARIEVKGDYEGFDYITGVESRIFNGKAPEINEVQKGWMLEMGMDALKREELFRSSDRIIYNIKYPDETPFSGVEGVYVNGNRVHLARVFFHKGVYGKVYENVKSMLQNMVLVH